MMPRTGHIVVRPTGYAKAKQMRVPTVQRGDDEYVTLFNPQTHPITQPRNPIDAAAGLSSGCKILTHQGRRSVSSLTSGDRVWTMNGGLRALKWCMHRKIALRPKTEYLRPVCIAAGALDENKPSTDIVVAPGQRLLLNDWRIPKFLGVPEVLALAGDIVGQSGVAVDTCAQVVQYTYIQFSRFELVEVDGIIAETFQNDRRFSIFARGALQNALNSKPSRPLLTHQQAQMFREISLERS